MSDDLLLRLADRCEREQPSRELDRAIWLAVVPGATHKTTHVPHPKGAYTIEEERQDHRLVIVPAYTTSLDAAVTLVPDGAEWHWLAVSSDVMGEPMARVCTVENSQHMKPGRAMAVALSICAAALRARAATSARPAPS